MIPLGTTYRFFRLASARTWTCRWAPESGRVGRSIPARGIHWRERSSRTARRAASSGSSVGAASATWASRRRAPLDRHAPSSVLPVGWFEDCERFCTARSSASRPPRPQHPASLGTARSPKSRRRRKSPRRSPRRDPHRHHTYTPESYTRRTDSRQRKRDSFERNRWRGEGELVSILRLLRLSRNVTWLFWELLLSPDSIIRIRN